MPRPCLEFGSVYDLKWSQGDTYIACGGGDNVVTIYDIRANRQMTRLKGHVDSVKSVEWGKDNPKLLHSGGRDGDVIIWDLRCRSERQLTQRISLDAQLQIKAKGRGLANVHHSVTAILQQDRTPWRLITASSGSGYRVTTLTNSTKLLIVLWF